MIFTFFLRFIVVLSSEYFYYQIHLLLSDVTNTRIRFNSLYFLIISKWLSLKYAKLIQFFYNLFINISQITFSALWLTLQYCIYLWTAFFPSFFVTRRWSVSNQLRTWWFSKTKKFKVSAWLFKNSEWNQQKVCKATLLLMQ